MIVKSPIFLKKLDIFLLILLPPVATWMTMVFSLHYLWSILLFFGTPALYFSLRVPKMVVRTAIFSIVCTIPFVTVLNYIGVRDGSWYILDTIFPFRILGSLPIEDFIWFFLLIYGLVICYEHFLDKGKHALVDKKMKYLLWPLGVLLIVFFSLFIIRPDLLKIRYAYFWIGMLFIFLPMISMISFFPRLLSKYLKVGSYFAMLLAIFEYTAISLGWWVFPGKNFIGLITYFGYKIPFEELFFWIILSVISMLSYYEFFDDDRK